MQRLLLIVAATALLAGCDTVREEVGLGKRSPDEFRVVAQAPLSMPPNFNLRPPAPGSTRPQTGSPSEQAQVAIFGREGRVDGQTAAAANGEQALLQSFGAQNNDPNIRAVVNEETRAGVESNTQFLDELIFWKDNPSPGTVVDAQQEADRIREAQALGQPVTTGETPIVIRRERGLLQEIF